MFGMNYWIFVHKSEDTRRSFSQLMSLQNWGFFASTPTKNKIDALQEGDTIIFYVGGPAGGFFAGEAKLTSGTYKPTRESLGTKKDRPLDAMVNFDEVDTWNGKKIYLKERSIRESLSFIKNKDNWGMAVGQSIIKINGNDYKEIKSLLG
jgi:hypothetical protein